jgi:hypothetical protein
VAAVWDGLLPCYRHLFQLWKFTSDLGRPRRSGNGRVDPAVHVSARGRRGVHYARELRKPRRLFFTQARDVRSNSVNGCDVRPEGPPYVSSWLGQASPAEDDMTTRRSVSSAMTLFLG